MVPLASELNRHLEALELDPIDDLTFGLLRDLADMDPYGESLRYADNQSWDAATNGYHVDFPALADAIEGMNDMLTMTVDSIGEATGLLR